jgi:hypothetical protein
MRLFKAAGLASLAFAMTATPSLAQTQYSWPLQVIQPINVKNLPFIASSQLTVDCSMPVSLIAGGTTTIAGSAQVPVGAVVNGTISFNGNVAVSLNGAAANGAAAPASGNVVTCLLRSKTAGAFTNVGSEILTLP